MLGIVWFLYSLSQCSAFVFAFRSHLPISPSALQSTLTRSAAVAQEETGLLGLTLNDLSDKLGGAGRASAVWDCFRQGIDPNLHYSSQTEDPSDRAILKSWIEASSGDVMDIKDVSFPVSDKVPSLGQRVWFKIQNAMANYKQPNQETLTIENCVATISELKVSSDGTTKLLLRMARDGLEVESVIIPWKEKRFSTLCVSSQVGCKQGCTFCATGRMGKLRDLSTDEILVQVYYAAKVCRVVGSYFNAEDNIMSSQGSALPNVDNIVFMGMGEPGDNAEAVLRAANAMADRKMFSLAQSKITISTVAPDTNTFEVLGKAPALLAWSVHAVKDSLRQRLVPTTKSSMEKLRLSLVEALSARTKSMRRTMLEVALIDGVNDSDEDASCLAEFAQAIMRDVDGAKVVVNLIPFNDIGHPTYKTPSMNRVLQFKQRVIQGNNCTDGDSKPVLCYIRTTRGDEESSACGQLATKKHRQT